MNHIDENKIKNLLNITPSAAQIDAVIEKARALQRLTLEETAMLIASNDKRIFETAAFVKNEIYGNRVVMFVPLYISNVCQNVCTYCAFAAGNKGTRKQLTIDEIKAEISRLLKRGHKRILMVAGEMPGGADYYVQAMEAIYSVKEGKNQIKRVNINAAPLSVEDFKKLKNAGIGTYQIFQETYHEETYRKLHLKGPKTDPDKRLAAIDNAFAAGIDDVGIGPLLGLYDWKFEILAMLQHIEYLEKTYGFGPHTISVPRVEPASGSDYSCNPEHPVSDEDFRKLVAILRLSVPYTGIIMSTRERPALRDELVNLGVSQISAESKVAPDTDASGQFSLQDNRTLSEIVTSLINQGYVPSFCAGCYRKNRTGEAFMSLARPGNIKQKCEINALVTLKEYLEDFADHALKEKGYALIKKNFENLSAADKEIVEKLFTEIDNGKRDLYV
jgi:2-iminoacetate synthase